MYDRAILAIIRENIGSEGRLPREFILPKDQDDENNAECDRGKSGSTVQPLKGRC